MVVNDGCHRWLERDGNKKEKGMMTYFVLCVVMLAFRLVLRFIFIILYYIW